MTCMVMSSLVKSQADQTMQDRVIEKQAERSHRTKYMPFINEMYGENILLEIHNIPEH